MSAHLKQKILKSLLWVPVIVFVNNHVVSATFIQGRSMQPALNPDKNLMAKDLVILNKMVSGSLSKKFIKRGDVVTLRSPSDPDSIIIKRIIGLPGDIIEPIQVHNKSHKLPDKLKIPEGHCWVEGDEGFHSIDSNTFGYIPLGLVHGRASFVLYPFSNMGFIGKSIPEWKKKRISPGNNE
ncbi:hypothetical protein BB558_007468 [Smittium angustum]|uniref:Mitochondrial inner membrane protease subunit n=1 Tax=Smittium angustum TaxID=133377 RepID=A0A2U1IUZ0_SMIAN|nr:hypothetical protein BB558_007468 [Smittium angustum]